MNQMDFQRQNEMEMLKQTTSADTERNSYLQNQINQMKQDQAKIHEQMSYRQQQQQNQQ
jgi:hypothetical protein